MRVRIMVEANKKPRIAFLEDDLAYAETILDWFNEAGFEVDHFVTGLDFLRKFPNAQYDLCLFDWALPDMEGPDVMVSIKLRSNKLPPIISFAALEIIDASSTINKVLCCVFC